MLRSNITAEENCGLNLFPSKVTDLLNHKQFTHDMATMTQYLEQFFQPFFWHSNPVRPGFSTEHLVPEV